MTATRVYAFPVKFPSDVRVLSVPVNERGEELREKGRRERHLSWEQVRAEFVVPDLSHAFHTLLRGDSVYLCDCDSSSWDQSNGSAIITTIPNELIVQGHNRMPVIHPPARPTTDG